MKRVVALCGALILTIAMAAPAAADQKVRAEDLSGEYKWTVKVAMEGDWYWEGWACTKPVWYKGDFKDDFWFWYANNVDEADMMPVGKPWPWKRGMIKSKGVDTFAANRDFKGKVLRSTLRLTERMYDHRIRGNTETWKVKLSGKDWNLSAPGYGWIFKFVPNWRYNITITDGNWAVTDRVKRGTTVEVYDYHALCDFFDAGEPVFWNPWD